MIQLSIIIICYRNERLIIDCLRTVYSQTSKISFEVLIVDNDPAAGSKKNIIEDFPGARWIDMPYNGGFARGNNEGIRQSNGEIILLLNADTLIINNAIERCFELFENSPYAACGVQLINPDRTPQISGSHFMAGALNNLLPLPVTGQVLTKVGHLLRVREPGIKSTDSLVNVDWINGAFLMVRKDVILKSGLMDEDFFLYAEEAEWCSRIGRFGKLCLFGSVQVVHLQGETINVAFNSPGKGYYNLYDRKGRQMMVSNFLRIRKQLGIGWFLFHMFCYSVELVIYFLAVIIALLIPRRNSIFSFANFGGYLKNLGYLWRLAPRMISNKPNFYKVL